MTGLSIVLAALATGAALAWLGLAQRQRRMGASRGGWTRERFVACFPETERDAAGAVWARLAEEAIAGNFRPAPEDDIGHVYGIVDEDLDELASELCGGPPVGALRAPVRTAADLVRLVHAARVEGGLSVVTGAAERGIRAG